VLVYLTRYVCSMGKGDTGGTKSEREDDYISEFRNGLQST
jgi:hypothetical protein